MTVRYFYRPPEWHLGYQGAEHRAWMIQAQMKLDQRNNNQRPLHLVAYVNNELFCGVYLTE